MSSEPFSDNVLINVFKMLTDRLDTIENMIVDCVQKNQDHIDCIRYHFNVSNLDELRDRHNALISDGDHYLRLWKVPLHNDGVYMSMVTFLEPYFLRILTPIRSMWHDYGKACSIFVNPNLLFVHKNQALSSNNIIFPDHTFSSDSSFPYKFFEFLMSDNNALFVQHCFQRFGSYRVTVSDVPPRNHQFTHDDWQFYHGIDTSVFSRDHHLFTYIRFDF